MRSISSPEGEKLPIRDRALLISALEELKQMVGLKRLKESIGVRCMGLIHQLRENKSNCDKLNVVIYGRAGVGKTTVGKILAKIYYALGFLQGGSYSPSSEETPITPFRINAKSGYLSALFMLLFWLALFILLLGYVVKSIGWAGLVLAIISVIVLSFVDRKRDVNEFNTENAPVENRNESKINPDELTVLAGREDFVAGYLGQTAPKTKDFLEKNKGRVILVDEAYTLLQDDRDQFGKEAVGVLLKYMTEYPNQTCVIFMGYQEELRDGIFALNKGLRRRFTYHFQCDDYTGEELWIMFKQQLNKKNLLMNGERNKIKSLFLRRSNTFTDFGGDMERLAQFIELETVKDIYMDSSAEKVFGLSHFRVGLEQLAVNNI